MDEQLQLTAGLAPTVSDVWPVRGRWVGEYFIGFDAVHGRYVPNSVLRNRYPDDVSTDPYDVDALETAVCLFLQLCSV
jgi:hypothetical protein